MVVTAILLFVSSYLVLIFTLYNRPTYPYVESSSNSPVICNHTIERIIEVEKVLYFFCSIFFFFAVVYEIPLARGASVRNLLTERLWQPDFFFFF